MMYGLFESNDRSVDCGVRNGNAETLTCLLLRTESLPSHAIFLPRNRSKSTSDIEGGTKGIRCDATLTRGCA